MIVFEDIQDIRDWLQPMDYTALWQAAAPYQVFAEDDREHFDGLIIQGEVPQDTILECLKTSVRLALTEQFGLQERMYEPVTAQYLRTTH